MASNVKARFKCTTGRVVACALCLTVGCSKEPLPAVRQARSSSVSDLQPFLDMNIAVSPDARLKAQETLEGFFARRGSSTRVEYKVLAGVPDHSGTWPLLLYLCVHEVVQEVDHATPIATDHVVALTGTAMGHYFSVADMLGDTTVIMEPALFNASFPGPLKAQMRACLKVPAPVPRP